ncbi:hypothetical protein EYZ11_002901 [Aspergillus tanneri]|uniref:Uncharacterized protein n=1 Tax=Aspergillus tanneri TaxID=1220188 RepID=A0A4S3JTY3_9EURO|nr:hypothetical protein EYZ11_002901 [Aspergillus tanneri]
MPCLRCDPDKLLRTGLHCFERCRLSKRSAAKLSGSPPGEG